MERTTTAATDRDLGSPPSSASFHADPEEHFSQAATSPGLARAARWAALGGAFAVHALVVFLLVFEYRWETAAPPAEQEIPVEIIVEPPPKPPAPPAPSPEPSSPTQPLNEEAAHDAPRAANDEKVTREAPDEKTKAPTSAKTAETPGEESAPEKPEPPARQSETAPAPQPPAPTPDKAAEASEGAMDANAQSPDADPARAATDAPPDRTATFVGQPLPNWNKGGQFSTFDALPDVEFGSAAAPTTVSGGKAKSTYLTVLYGMIMSRVHYASSRAGAEGEIVFVVDGTGHLVQRQIARPSGSRELDAIALQAVADAGPFPAPPQGQPVRLRFTYGSK